MYLILIFRAKNNIYCISICNTFPYHKIISHFLYGGFGIISIWHHKLYSIYFLQSFRLYHLCTVIHIKIKGICYYIFMRHILFCRYINFPHKCFA